MMPPSMPQDEQGRRFADEAQPSARGVDPIPLLIAFYFGAALLVRLWLSTNLEVDEAAFVHDAYWALGYPGSQPPLYNWLVLLVLKVTGYWPAIAAIKFSLLAAIFILVYDAVKRAHSGFAGRMAIASLALIPPFVWLAQITLAHSVLAAAAAAATLHAVVVILQRGRARDFVWLGCAMTAGLLAKYNYPIFLVSLAIGVASVAETRRAFCRPATAVTMLAALFAIAPHAIWALQHLHSSAAHLDRFHKASFLHRFGLPASPVDGVLSLALLTTASLAPMVLAYGITSALARRRTSPHDNSSPQLAQVLQTLAARTAVISLLLCAAILLTVHAHSTMARWLMPTLLPIAIWFSLGRERVKSGSAGVYFQRIALVTAGVCLLLIAALPFRVEHAFSAPYQDWARQISAWHEAPVAIVASRPEMAANLVLRIPKSRFYTRGDSSMEVLAVASSKHRDAVALLARQLSVEYVPDSEVRDFSSTSPLRPAVQQHLLVQLWRRMPVR